MLPVKSASSNMHPRQFLICTRELFMREPRAATLAGGYQPAVRLNPKPNQDVWFRTLNSNVSDCVTVDLNKCLQSKSPLSGYHVVELRKLDVCVGQRCLLLVGNQDKTWEYDRAYSKPTESTGPSQVRTARNFKFIESLADSIFELLSSLPLLWILLTARSNME